MHKKTLSNLQDVKNYFAQSDKNFYFISASNFNLMVMSDWVKNWFNVNFIDCYDQQNTSVILPDYDTPPVFKNSEAINHFLLGNKKIVEHIKEHGSGDEPANVLFLFYDVELEKLVKSMNMALIMPSNTLVKHIDNKIHTTEIANSVAVPSVPNALTKIENYQQLQDIIEKHHLSNKNGNEVVIQTAYGDSGKTTYFISNHKDYHKVSKKIEAEDKVKVMRQIDCQQVAIEACATRNGTFIGPILTEIIGNPDLTPYKGGWCGNDINPNVFSPKTQQIIYDYTERLGGALYNKGYKGYFEADFLIDTADNDQPIVYLGEINPRVTGISALTNMSDFCNNNIPLFLFHLLEYTDTIDINIDSKKFNQQVLEYSHRPFGQLVFKFTQNELKIITKIPKTGVYKINDQQLSFIRYADNPKNIADDEIFILRIIKNDDYVYKGADMLIMFANHLIQDADKNLSSFAENAISTIKQAITVRDLNKEEEQISKHYASHASMKSQAQD